ncbi:hypothetical protein Scuro_28 [Acinetobacter phage Scuro]|nr:hypothetical protein Scuro_28 [Acinetobacter phage Scuro]
MNLNEWAIKWGVSAEALEDLRREFGCIQTDTPIPEKGNNEAAVQAHIRLEASNAGARLWRNNVGVLKDERGVPVRYGLCNDSKQLNEKLKSSDLIGIRPVLITPQHVGQTIGQFIAREVKAPTWRYTGTKREQAQLRFLELIVAKGGDACFANGPGTI